MSKKYKSLLREGTEAILKDHPLARINDTYLELKVAKEFFNLEIDEDQIIKLVGSGFKFESIRRYRQLLQNAEGRYLPPKKEEIKTLKKELDIAHRHLKK